MARTLAILSLVAGFTTLVVAEEADRAALKAIMTEQMDYYLKGDPKEMRGRFKAAFPTDAELKLIYGDHAPRVIKLRDSFIETVATEHYWKLHAEQIRKAESIREVTVVEKLNIYTQQMIDKGFIKQGVTVLMAAGQDSRGRWESYEYAWIGDRWAMLPPNAYEVMTKPEG